MQYKLKEKDPNNSILDQKYSDIILIFDYDPQDNRYRKERIELMLSYFSESTENGKLYINYPMLESYKHFKEFPEEAYLERKIKFEVVKRGKYKELVDQEAKYTKLTKFKKPIWNQIIKSNIQKAKYMISMKKEIQDVREAYHSIKHTDILQVQNQMLKEQKEIYVLNTCVFFICDYNFALIEK